MTLFKGSRYEAVPLFVPDAEGRSNFAGLRARPVGPAKGVLEHAIETRDRLDALGFRYFAEPRLWHRVAAANPDVLFPEDLVWEAAEEDFAAGATREQSGGERLGAQVLIPKAREG